MADTNSQQHLSGDSAVEKVRELLKNFRSTMMVTQNGAGIHTRPMGLLSDAKEFSETLCFFTDDRSAKLQEIGGGQPVWLLFQSDDKSAYLELDGRAQNVNDRGLMEKLYTPLIRTWFPDGLDDPHLTLIRFTAESGRFWESPGGMLQVLAAFTKSVLTGSPGKAGTSGDLQI